MEFISRNCKRLNAYVKYNLDTFPAKENQQYTEEPVHGLVLDELVAPRKIFTKLISKSMT